MAITLVLLSACSDDTGDGGATSDASADGSTNDGSAADATVADSEQGRPKPPVPDNGAPLTLTTCDGATRSLYDPVAGVDLTAFPDDFFTTWTGSASTGLRPDLGPERVQWLKTLPAGFQKVFTDLAQLDGWGTTADLFVRFSGPLGALPSGDKASINQDALILARLDDGGPVRIPFEATTTDDGTTILVSPMIPLRPKSAHALLVTRKLNDTKGGCVGPSKAAQMLLEGRVSGDLAAYHTARMRAAAKALGVALEDVTVALPFTTQSISERSVAVATAVIGTKAEPGPTFTWSADAMCEAPTKTYKQCDRKFKARDYRKFHVDGAAPQWELDVRAWLPLDGKGPWPTVIYGHGLSSGRSQGKKLAELAVPLGVAVVAIDALRHADHPSGGGKGTIDTVLKFFGVDAKTLSFDFLALRGHWQQSTWDKLQLIELLRDAPDLDGDGKADFSDKKLAYLGVSLGGIMGPELLALSDEIGAAVLSVPGGKVSSIIQSSKQFGPLIYAFKPPETSDGDVDRFFAVLQTLLDGGDAANYAPHVLKDRLRGDATHAPHVLMQMAIGDDIVPNVATRALARAMAIPQAAPKFAPISLLPDAPKTPFEGNLGGVTAALFQFDRVRDRAGDKVQAADHSGTPGSYEAFEQDRVFMQSFLAGKKPQVIDPYETLKTPPIGP